MSDSVLSESDKIKFGDLFQSYRDVFTNDQLGKTSLVQHVIDSGDALPAKQRPYRTSPKCKQEIDRQVEDMLQKGNNWRIRFSMQFTRSSRQEKGW